MEANVKTPQFILTSRTQSDVLFALMHGDRFLELLINKIEGIESKEKAIARKKYSRNIIHFYDRLLRPNANVYSANGGSMHFDVSDGEREALLSKIGRARDGKSLREWLKSNWMPLYHSDPNGVIFIEYETIPELKCWPTYQNINHIRSYKPKGQLVDWIIFEPIKVVINNRQEQVYRLVDDKTDRRLVQKSGGKFEILKTIKGKPVTFEHPFGQVPCIINSDIKKFKGDYRLSPVNGIVDLSEEYARDQSVKTLYKKFMGFPKEWKYGDQCMTCQGARKDNDGNKCGACDGHGFYTSDDVTDIQILEIPNKDEVKITPEIRGYSTPPLDVWEQYNTELSTLDEMAHHTHWGTMAGFASKVTKTATEIFYDTQPMTDKLNDLADVGESIENQIVEWYANFVIPLKPKDKKISSIHYGRRYIIDPPDVILGKYEQAKLAGDNNVILDRLYNEYLTARFRRDPEFLRVMLLKSSVEPYLHLSNEEVSKIFGNLEAQRKVLFQRWWNTLGTDSTNKTTESLTEDFDKWFTDKAIVQQVIEPNNGGDE
jgi:hypothetical protein